MASHEVCADLDLVERPEGTELVGLTIAGRAVRMRLAAGQVVGQAFPVSKPVEGVVGAGQHLEVLRELVLALQQVSDELLAAIQLVRGVEGTGILRNHVHLLLDELTH